MAGGRYRCRQSYPNLFEVIELLYGVTWKRAALLGTEEPESCESSSPAIKSICIGALFSELCLAGNYSDQQVKPQQLKKNGQSLLYYLFTKVTLSKLMRILLVFIVKNVPMRSYIAGDIQKEHVPVQ
jgi:hypothetical protein